MTVTEVQKHLSANIPGCQIRVRDLTGTGDHFRVEIASSTFIGESLPAQHRMVYDALGELMTTAIHALSIKTYAPAEWDDSVHEADSPPLSGVHISSPPTPSEENNE